MPGRTFTEEERKRGGYTRKSQPSFSRYGFNEKAARKKRPSLTKREKEILRQATKSNGEIAKIFSIAEKTVTNHFTHIMNKLGCNNRTEALQYAETHHLFDERTSLDFSASTVSPI